MVGQSITCNWHKIMGLTDVIQGLEEDDCLHRTEMKGMVEAESELHFILDIHVSRCIILSTTVKGGNYDPRTDEQIEA